MFRCPQTLKSGLADICRKDDTMPCVHCGAPTDKLKRQHCDGKGGDGKDRWYCPSPGACHIAVVCQACDYQYTEYCEQHAKAA